MWSIGDEDAPLVADKVYEHSLEGGNPDARRAAVAVHHAVACLGNKVGIEEFISRSDWGFNPEPIYTSPEQYFNVYCTFYCIFQTCTLLLSTYFTSGSPMAFVWSLWTKLTEMWLLKSHILQKKTKEIMPIFQDC